MWPPQDNIDNYDEPTLFSWLARIALVEEQHFDVLLVDLKLPFINSFELYLAVKEIQPDIVAIIWTDNNQEREGLTESALQNDASVCLNGPLVVADVLKLIDEVLLKRQVAGCMTGP